MNPIAPAETDTVEPVTDELSEPGLSDGWWEETPAEAARYDRKYFD